MSLLRRARLVVAKWALSLLSRYFPGKPLVMETAKAAVEGRIASAKVDDTDLILTWVPLGGTLADARKVSVFSIRRNGKVWVFYD